MFRIECCREVRLKYVYSVVAPCRVVSVLRAPLCQRPKGDARDILFSVTSPFSRSVRAPPFSAPQALSDDVQQREGDTKSL